MESDQDAADRYRQAHQPDRPLIVRSEIAKFLQIDIVAEHPRWNHDKERAGDQIRNQIDQIDDLRQTVRIFNPMLQYRRQNVDFDVRSFPGRNRSSEETYSNIYRIVGDAGYESIETPDSLHWVVI